MNCIKAHVRDMQIAGLIRSWKYRRSWKSVDSIQQNDMEARNKDTQGCSSLTHSDSDSDSDSDPGAIVMRQKVPKEARSASYPEPNSAPGSGASLQADCRPLGSLGKGCTHAPWAPKSPPSEFLRAEERGRSSTRRRGNETCAKLQPFSPGPASHCQSFPQVGFAHLQPEAGNPGAAVPLPEHQAKCLAPLSSASPLR